MAEESFSIFDYTASIQMLGDAIVEMTNKISNIQNRITLIESATDYAAVTQNTLEDLNSNKIKLEKRHSDMQAVLDEINNLLMATDEEKASLYYFYTILQVNKKEYMKRLLFNYSSAITNPTIIQLVADTETSTEAKIEVARILYETFSIKSEYSFVISALPL